MSKLITSVLGGCLAAVLVLPILVYLMVVNGFVLSVLWGWFIVPVFGLPALTVGSAIGVAMVVTFVLRGLADKHNDPKQHKEQVIQVLTVPWIMLGLGYLLTLFL